MIYSARHTLKMENAVFFVSSGFLMALISYDANVLQVSKVSSSLPPADLRFSQA